MTRRLLSTALLAVAVLTGLAGQARAEDQAPVTFSAMGDGPRSEVEWPEVARQVFNENAHAESAFIVHLGDITSGTDVLPEWYYAGVAALLQMPDKPLYIVPGDNEWNDLDDPSAGWAHWNRYFLNFEQHFSPLPPTEHQVERPENFAFITHGVLFLGITLVGGTVHDAVEWRTRHQENVQWVKRNFEAKVTSVRAAVVLAQARPKPQQEDFFAPFVAAAEQFAKPVLYLHGDGHTYEIEKAFRVPNLTRAQVDSVGKNPPLRVTVTMDPADPFLFDRNLPPAAGAESK